MESLSVRNDNQIGSSGMPATASAFRRLLPNIRQRLLRRAAQIKPYAQVILTAKYVAPEVAARRVAMCQQCDECRVRPSGAKWCRMCGHGIGGADLRIEDLATYEEHLPRWGCKHPLRKEGKGWPIGEDGSWSKAESLDLREHGVEHVATPTLIPDADLKAAVRDSQVQCRSLLFSGDGKPVDLENLFRGRSCFLICGGSSFGRLDHSKLREPGILTMGVNNSPKTFRPNLWTCCDAPDHYIRSIWLDPTILKLAPMEFCHSHVFDSDRWNYLDITLADCPNVFCYRSRSGFDPAKFLTGDSCFGGNDDRNGNGRSVMLPAIRLLYYLGVRRVFLLGCDFRMTNNHAYHLGQPGASDSTQRHNNYNILRERFRLLRPVFEAAGLRIYNCNLKSKLDAFETISFDHAYAKCLEEWGNIDVVTERTIGLHNRPKPEPPGPQPARNRFWHSEPVIPPIVHFVWLGSPLPTTAANLIKRFKKLNPSLKVKLWTKIPAKMPAVLRAAAEKMPQLCQQADLVRLWVLSTHGGIYLDTDIYFLRSMEGLRHYENFIVRGNDKRIFNGVMGFAKSNPVLCLLLRKACALAPTAGPEMIRTLFGPRLVTDFHSEHPGQLNVLPSHYFYIVHSHASALSFVKGSPEDQKREIYNRRGRMTDSVQPFAIHLWGFPADAMPTQVGRSSFARVRPNTQSIPANESEHPAGNIRHLPRFRTSRAGAIVSAFHSRNDDWVLPHKLRVLSAICDRVLVILDRSPQSEVICKRFSKVEVMHWENTRSIPDIGSRGLLCEEGLMRQTAWNWCAAQRPENVILGDSDEVPTPDIVPWLASRPQDVDLWYMDWVNLFQDAGHAIGGRNIWSFEVPTNNKKGVVVRYRPDGDYHYRTDMTQHCRLEPSPLSQFRAVIDDRHRLLESPKLVHYKWANWERWSNHPQVKLPEFSTFLKNVKTVPVPRAWLWRWDADELLRTLPDPVAVVGNGPVNGRGEEIDAHQSVLRLNDFHIVGYEMHIGSKTTAWCANCWEDVPKRPWTGEVFTHYTDNEQYGRISSWLGAYPHLRVPTMSWIEPARVYKQAKPSTGLVLLTRLIHHGKRVDAYGFDGMKTGHLWNPRHKHDHGDESGALAALAGKGVKFV